MQELSIFEVDEVSGAGVKEVMWVMDQIVEFGRGLVDGWEAGNKANPSNR